MDSVSKSFTLQATGILRRLETPCWVCPAYDPSERNINIVTAVKDKK